MLAKTKLNIKEVLTSKALINSNTSHDEFVSVKNVLREYNYMKEPIKNFRTINYGNVIANHWKI